VVRVAGAGVFASPGCRSAGACEDSSPGHTRTRTFPFARSYLERELEFDHRAVPEDRAGVAERAARVAQVEVELLLCLRDADHPQGHITQLQTALLGQANR